MRGKGVGGKALDVQNCLELFYALKRLGSSGVFEGKKVRAKGRSPMRTGLRISPQRTLQQLSVNLCV